MTELILMPTTNWLTSRPIDISHGQIAFSALTSIILTDDRLASYNSTIKDAHAKRILAVAFYKGSNPNHNDHSAVLASCSEDMEVKVWNTATNSLLSQHKLHQNVPVCLDWLDLDSSEEAVLLSCDLKGNIFKYNVYTSAHTRYFPENKPISQIRTCPNSYLAAVGYRQGTIVLLDVRGEQNKIVHKLKSHEDTINCLHWFPATGHAEKETCQKLMSTLSTENLSRLLCSSSEDKTIRLWCADRGVELRKIDSPGGKDSNKKVVSNMGFTPLCWPEPRCILSGSFKGDLYALDLTSDEATTAWRPFAGDKPHKKVIYEIAACGERIVTLSLDRLVNVWSLSGLRQVSSMTTLNGYVYSIVSSPIEPDVMALSVGDSSVKLLNEKQNRRVTKHLTNNIKSEVTQVNVFWLKFP